MKHKLIIGVLLLSLIGACAQKTDNEVDQNEVDTIDEIETVEETESFDETEAVEESESTESNTSEDTQTKTSRQKRHGALESETSLINIYDLYKNEEI